MEIANLIINIFVAIGTIGAVIAALYLNYISTKPKLKIIKINTEDRNKLYYSFKIFNKGNIEPIIKQLGFSNKKKMCWQKLGIKRSQYKKDFLDEILLDKITYYHFPVKLKSGEMLAILLDRYEMLDIKNNLKRGKIKLKLIFMDESRITIKLTTKEINNYLEESNKFDGGDK